MFPMAIRCRSGRTGHSDTLDCGLKFLRGSTCLGGNYVSRMAIGQRRAVCTAVLQGCSIGQRYGSKAASVCYMRMNFTTTTWSELIESFTKSSSETLSGTSKGLAVLKVKNQLNQALTARRSHEEGNLLPSAIASEICRLYSSLDNEDDKHAFFSLISSSLDVDTKWISKSIDSYNKAEEREPAVLLKARERLSSSLDPPYKHLLKDIGHLEEGVRMLVDMRKDLLSILKRKSEYYGEMAMLHAFDKHLKQHLAQWFSAGFLNLHRVTWNSPAALLEKIMDYEQVHPTRGWAEFKRRLHEDRRCFIFTHRLLPGEPLVILHTALGDHLRTNMEGIHTPPAENKVPDDVTAATFYTISSTQKGLSGIDLGNYLIKVAVQQLKTEFPTLRDFGTLSPIPGFARWLHQTLKTKPDSIDSLLRRHCSSDDQTLVSDFTVWLTSLKESTRKDYDISKRSLSYGEFLRKLCARYLYFEKRRGFALDPVANFHLRNGAVFWRLNSMADESNRGMDRSYGIMTNYKYNLSQIERNNKQYVIDGKIEVSSSIRELLD